MIHNYLINRQNLNQGKKVEIIKSISKLFPIFIRIAKLQFAKLMLVSFK